MCVTSHLQCRSVNMLSCTGPAERSGNAVWPARGSLSSAATAPRGHSFYTLFSSISSIARLRRRRSTLTRFNPGHALPQVRLFPGRRFNSHVATCRVVYCVSCSEVAFCDCLSLQFVCKQIYMLCLCVCIGDFVSSPNNLTELLSSLFLQVHLMALPSAFGVKFQKCAQVLEQSCCFFLLNRTPSF